MLLFARVAVGDGVAAGAGVTLDVFRTEVLALNSRTPFSGRPHLIASLT
jgi:hypothetical protein